MFRLVLLELRQAHPSHITPRTLHVLLDATDTRHRNMTLELWTMSVDE